MSSQMPNNPNAEAALLGALMINPDQLIAIAPLVKVEDFFTPRYGWIYEVLLDLRNQGKAIDQVTITGELEARGQLDKLGGPGAVNELTDVTPTWVHAVSYAEQIIDLSKKRRAINAGIEIAKIGHSQDLGGDQVLESAEKTVFEMAMQYRHFGRGSKFIRSGVGKYHDRLERIQAGQMVGLPTGIKDLDKNIGGLQDSDLIILAGRPGMGKSSLAVQIAASVSRTYQKISQVFSLEMSEEQLAMRLISAESGIPSQRLRNGEIHENEYPQFLQASANVESWPVIVDDTPAITIEYVRSEARKTAVEHGLDLIVIDYLQLMSGSGKRQMENRQQEISFISRGLKDLARELNIPILALSQLNRSVESRADKRPTLADLRESGAIEQDADIVIFIYRDDLYHDNNTNIAELIIGKHRHGPTGKVDTFFEKQFTRFHDLAKKTEVQDYATNGYYKNGYH